MLAGNILIHFSIEIKKGWRISENDMPDNLFGDNQEDNGKQLGNDESMSLLHY